MENCKEPVRYTLRKGTTIEPLRLINITSASIHEGVERPPYACRYKLKTDSIRGKSDKKYPKNQAIFMIFIRPYFYLILSEKLLSCFLLYSLIKPFSGPRAIHITKPGIFTRLSRQRCDKPLPAIKCDLNK
jgi:hypothetical protein